jgi:hypothetical protein
MGKGGQAGAIRLAAAPHQSAGRCSPPWKLVKGRRAVPDIIEAKPLWADDTTTDGGFRPLADDDGTPLGFTRWYRRRLDNSEAQLSRRIG